jgi:hypothetical protein
MLAFCRNDVYSLLQLATMNKKLYIIFVRVTISFSVEVSNNISEEYITFFKVKVENFVICLGGKIGSDVRCENVWLQGCQRFEDQDSQSVCLSWHQAKLPPAPHPTPKHFINLSKPSGFFTYHLV